MTRNDAISEFREHHLQGVVKQFGMNDVPALRQAWNDYTDGLHRDGRITDYQVNHWNNPF